ncbi:MAG: hypothetical protein LBI29_01850 [Rickettsiales bacterium]|jgi:hypothetical protein|nr:hypothetical protein [Rickettsiales bacterium]
MFRFRLVNDLIFISLGLLSSEASDLGLRCTVNRFVYLGKEKILVMSFLARMLALAIAFYLATAGSFRKSIMMTLGIFLSRVLLRFWKIKKLKARYAHKH